MVNVPMLLEIPQKPSNSVRIPWVFFLKVLVDWKQVVFFVSDVSKVERFTDVEVKLFFFERWQI